MPGLPNGEVFYFIVVEKVTGFAPEGTLRPAGRTLNVTQEMEGKKERNKVLTYRPRRYRCECVGLQLRR